MATGATFQATDNVETTDHAETRWRSRGFEGRQPDCSLEDAWRRSRDHAIHWGLHNATFARYHPPTDLILIAQRTHAGTPTGTQVLIVTCRRAQFDLNRKAVRQTIADALKEHPGRGTWVRDGGEAV